MSYVYVTKCVNADMTSRHDEKFVYPKKGYIEAPDWEASAGCGHGLHGFLWGEGDGSLSNYSDQSVWLLIRVNPADGLVDRGDKCKFRRGYVLAVSDYRTIAERLKKYLPTDRQYKVIGSTATAGYRGTATAGDYGTATAGGGGTATAGAIGAATAGDYGTATAGIGGTATAGNESTIIIIYWDEERKKYRRKVGQIGEDGLKPNVRYMLDSTHNFIEVSDEPKGKSIVG